MRLTPKAFHNREGQTMSQSLSQVYLHVTFSTKDRTPFLRDMQLRERMHAYLAGICKGQDSPSLIVGGYEDHVHVLCRLSKNLSVADLVREVRRDSSKHAKELSARSREFHLAARLRCFFGESLPC